jgi:hypothetical protein
MRPSAPIQGSPVVRGERTLNPMANLTGSDHQSQQSMSVPKRRMRHADSMLSGSHVDLHSLEDGGSTIMFRTKKDGKSSPSKRLPLTNATYFLRRCNVELKKDLINTITNIVSKNIRLHSQEQYLLPEGVSDREIEDSEKDDDDYEIGAEIKSGFKSGLEDDLEEELSEHELQRQLAQVLMEGSSNDGTSSRGATSGKHSSLRKKFNTTHKKGNSTHRSQVSFEPEKLVVKSKTTKALDKQDKESVDFERKDRMTKINRYDHSAGSSKSIIPQIAGGGQSPSTLKSAMRRPRTLITLNNPTSSETSSTKKNKAKAVEIPKQTSTAFLKAEVIGLVKTINAIKRKRLRESLYSIKKYAKNSKKREILLKKYTEDISDPEILEEPAVQEESRKPSVSMVRPIFPFLSPGEQQHQLIQSPTGLNSAGPKLLDFTSTPVPSNRGTLLESQILEDASKALTKYHEDQLRFDQPPTFDSQIQKKSYEGSMDPPQSFMKSDNAQKKRKIILETAFSILQKKYEKLCKKAFNFFRRRNDEYNALLRSNKMFARKLVSLTSNLEQPGQSKAKYP